ncbi:MAG: vitamin B12-dependent ribonucleotide reductase [Candidatus Thermoplasmatota archaeon]|jgi:ribonucleoside-diphosphate reductase alpha chain|nr:vitamin B12-dependent ribonucleotide reductase [Candidatus Thermoplasmatota archaeon]MCL5983300.1 vitamin B12-dependent ribonucleotide reductase [Candidatus Thermoplasmatota archaeon]
MAASKKRASPIPIAEDAGPSARTYGEESIPVPRLVPKGKTAFDTVTWRSHDALIKNAEGKVIFEQKGIRAPTDWSDTSVNIAASKYFRIIQGRRESSVDGMIRRVCHWIAQQGLALGYFDLPEEATTLEESLSYLMVHQMAAFNSPVWFNVGVREPPQCSACFIQSVADDMDSILALATSEGRLFKGGSGTGTNLSSLRGSHEHLSGGGIASGPVSFMRAFDAMAGVIKSGGTTRRAAKMVILNMDHPDIEEFIECKVKEEDKAYALIREGYSPNFDGTDPNSAYASIAYQNANHSVRIPDSFMEAVLHDQEWKTVDRTDHAVAGTYRARELWRKLAYAAWRCGDPGVQFDDITNDWHTSPMSGRINASNPCSEYLFLDDTACNLASINLMKFLDAKGQLDIELFRRAVRTMIVAMEILVDASSYPTAAIARNSHDYRPLGLGYANLGSLVMHYGFAYDSDPGRTLAGAISALLSAEGYHTSAEISKRMGPFSGFDKNRAPMLRVMGKHGTAAERIPLNDARLTPLVNAAVDRWHDTKKAGELWGYRNAQISVIAPTGTIGLLMGCDTLGLEPELSLVKVKNLVGGGVMKMVNRTVPDALSSLGYSESEIREIVKYVEEKGTIEGAPGLDPEDLPVFDCALAPPGGHRTIAPMGHLCMLGAVQPFLSGGASKTINLPNDATVEDIEKIYLEAWRLGIKSVALYRDGCKASQPYDTTHGRAPSGPVGPGGVRTPVRERLPDERRAITHHFSVGGHDGYVTVGLYPDGRPGEIFFRVTKEGSTVNGLMDSLGISMSMALQHGVPLKDLVRKLAHMRFEPAGATNNPKIRFAQSIPDYVARWLSLEFLTENDRRSIGLEGHSEGNGNGNGHATTAAAPSPSTVVKFEIKPLDSFETSAADEGSGRAMEDSPACPVCGGIMVRSGTCYACPTCGATSGCS